MIWKTSTQHPLFNIFLKVTCDEFLHNQRILYILQWHKILNMLLRFLAQFIMAKSKLFYLSYSFMKSLNYNFNVQTGVNRQSKCLRDHAWNPIHQKVVWILNQFCIMGKSNYFVLLHIYPLFFQLIFFP